MTVRLACHSFFEPSPACRCPKCDDDLLSQSDGTTLTCDIAHQRETVDQAMAKLDDVFEEAWRGYYQAVRFIVGGALIRDSVLGQLSFLQQQGTIQRFQEEGYNRGAILVVLRRSPH